MARPTVQGDDPLPSSDGTERRGKPRKSVIEVELVTVDLGLDQGALLLDISESGMGVQALPGINLGSTVPVSFDLPDTLEHVEGSGIIVWNDHGGRAGVLFRDLEPTVKARLRKWLNQYELAVPLPPTPPQVSQESAMFLALSADDIGELNYLREEIAGLEVSSALAVIAERTRVMTRASGLAIALSDGTSYVCRAATGTAPAIGVRLHLSAGLSGECIRTGQIVRCEDTETDPRADRLLCRRFGLRSAVLVPLKSDDVLVGVLEAFSDQPSAFVSADVLMLRRVGEVIVSVAASEIPVSVEESWTAPAAASPDVPRIEEPVAAAEEAAQPEAAPAPVMQAAPPAETAPPPSEPAEAFVPAPVSQPELLGKPEAPAQEATPAVPLASSPAVETAQPPSGIAPPAAPAEPATTPVEALTAPATAPVTGPAEAPGPAEFAPPVTPSPKEAAGAPAAKTPEEKAAGPTAPSPSAPAIDEAAPVATRKLPEVAPAAEEAPPRSQPQARSTAHSAQEPRPARQFDVPPSLLAQAEEPSSSRQPTIVLIVVLCAALGAGGWFLYQQWLSQSASRQQPSPSPAVSPSTQAGNLSAPQAPQDLAANTQIAPAQNPPAPSPVTRASSSPVPTTPAAPRTLSPANPVSPARPTNQQEPSMQPREAAPPVASAVETPAPPVVQPSPEATAPAISPAPTVVPAPAPAAPAAVTAAPPAPAVPPANSAPTPPASQPAAAGAPAPGRPAPPVPAPAVSEGVAGGRLLRRVEPVYPPAGRLMRLQGPVQLRATITTQGRVDKIGIVKGNPVLATAAIEAVKQWRYEPYTLNGKPLEMDVDIIVYFSMPR